MDRSGSSRIHVARRGSTGKNRVKLRMFRGLHEHTIDAKGRTSVPARFREQLVRLAAGARGPAAGADATVPSGGEGAGEPAGEEDPVLIVTTSMDRCLVAYAPDQWAAFEARLASLSQFDPAVVKLKRVYVAGATECPIDKHGRLLIPPVLREYAGLNRDIVWAGMVTTIEIWAKENWAAQMAASREDPQAIAHALTELGL